MEMRKLSPLRNTTKATTPKALATEQLQHFGINPATPFGESEDGDIRSYLVPAGALHRLVGAAQAAGISASFRWPKPTASITTRSPNERMPPRT